MTYTAGPPSSNKWTATATLYVDGVAGTPVSSFLVPDQVRGTNTLGGAQCNYLGKGPAGNYFAGYIDDFKIYAQDQNSTVITTLAGQFADRNAGPGVPPGGGTVSATPLVTLDASNLSTGAITTWTNTGSLGGSFSNDSTAPQVQSVLGKKCVTFSGSDHMKSSFTAPAGITSNGDWSVACWAYNPGIGAEECMVSWADRSAGSRDMQFNYGNATGWGAATHMSNDLGWYNAIAPTAGQWHHLVLTFTGGTNGTETVYVDGVSNNTATKTLNLFTGEPMFLACAFNSDMSTGWNFSGSLAKVQVYDVALTSTDVGHLYYNDLYPPADTTAPTPTTETWLINPTAVDANSITMSATKGTDDTGVEYNFVCTAGGGHSSGWISTNKYTDLGLTASTQYTYTVQMRDLLGNTGTVSTALAATTSANDTTAPTPNPATYAVAPVGISTSAITMSATKGTDANALIEYNFVGSNGHSSGWQASPTWTDTGLTANSTATYTVQMRDGRGNTGTASGSSPTATARDDQAPTTTSVARAVWQMRPYIKTNGQLWMRARTATDPSGVQYYFHCSAGGGPDSSWQDSNEWTSPTTVANGTYTYQIRIRDKSPQSNQTAYIGDINVVVNNFNLYHDYAVSALSGLADETLVYFTGTITTVNTDNYIVTSSGSTVRVYPNTTNGATDPTWLNKLVNVKGCMWTYTSTGKVVDFATVAKIQYTITASAGTGGSIAPSGAVLVDSGADQAFTITASPGNNISQVTVDSVNQGAITSYTFHTVTANHTISATFTPIQYTITASAGSNGTINPSGAVQVNGGTTPTFTITPNSGYVISDVLVDNASVGPQGPYTFPAVAANHTIAASFKTDPASDLRAYYKFNETGGTSAADWSGYAMGGALNGGCSWAAGKYSNAISLNGSNGYVSLPNGLVSSLTDFTVSAWVYLNTNNTWNRIFDFGTGTTYYMFLTGNAGSVTRYAIKANSGEQQISSTSALTTGAWHHVAVTLSGSTGTLYVDGGQAGQNTGMTLHPSSLGTTTQTWIGRSQFSDPYLNGLVDDFRIYNRALSGTEITNLYNWNGTWTITASAGTGGTITPSGNVAVNDCANQTFGISANSGYTISQVTVDGVNQGAISSYTFNTVTTNHTISATFASSNFTITASAGTGGTIDPSGAVQVAQGANQTFTITPSSGYMISSVTVDSVNVGCLRSYTFTNVQANHTIAAAFVANTDLVAYYKFDETSGTTAADCTANAKNGTLYGSCTWATGLTNNALSIPGGSSDYVGLPTGIVSGLTNFTVAAWVKLTSVSTNMRIFDFGTSTTNYMELTPKHSNSSGKIQFYIRTSSTTKSVTGTAALPTGSWQHVAVTLSSQTLTLYVQGAQVGQITNCTINPNSLGSTTNNYIGKSQTSSHPHLNGLVDGFRIYNRALSGTEITALYNGGAGPASVGGDDNSWIIIPAR